MHKPKQIIIAGKKDAPETVKMIKVVNKRFLPNKIFLLADKNGQNFLSNYLPFLTDMNPIDGKAAAYVCENYTCKLPTTDIEKMITMLES